MIETMPNELIQYGALGIMCAYFMIKDFVLNKNITKSLVDITQSQSKIAIIIDERLPKKE